MKQLSSHLAFFLLFFLLAASASSQPIAEVPKLLIVVNSNQDGEIQADEAITLREAIAIVNGTLPLKQLSPAEQSQVTGLTDVSRIEFNLPPQQTGIALQEELPPLASPELIIDGTTQPGYDPAPLAPSEIKIPMPLITITSAPDREILRGLTIVADNVTVRGLNLYGFTSKHRSTATTPPADIFIAHPLPPPDTSRQRPPNWTFPFKKSDIPPQGVVIEENWLGISTDGSVPQITSAFGISVFNSRGTTIRRNWIAHHDGSGIITSVRAENSQIQENRIADNGLAGMPDAIRLEGIITNTQVIGNEIRDNAGSGIYLFKSKGAIEIQDNLITNNGKRFQRAAIYLMGDGHVVVDNQIQAQSAPGVVVTAFPPSRGNRIQNNQFSRLDGLSIDLVTQQSVSPQDYQKGDGVNPIANSHQRRRKTGNFGIKTPRWVSSEFFISPVDGTVELAGEAEPNSQVDIYRVIEEWQDYGPLNEAIATVQSNDEGKFAIILQDLRAGERLSAITTHPEYGTSEPARNILIRAIDGTDQ